MQRVRSFYGYLDKDLPSQFRPFSLTAAQQADFVHNILLWDGDVVDENGNPVDVTRWRCKSNGEMVYMHKKTAIRHR